MNQETHLSMTEVSYSYPGGQQALDGITLSISKGERVGIIGPNGAGKSTMLQTILGLCYHDEGKIILNDVTLNKRSYKYFREEIGFLFQNPDNQLFCPTVRDDIAFGPSNHGLKGEELDKVIDEAIDLTDIKHIVDRAPYTLSGGEKKSAALASILSMRPNMILMDETSAHLDPKSRRRLINIINKLEQTLLIVSHDLDFIWECCGRVVIINGGKVITEGNVKEVLSDKDLLESNGMELPLRLQGCPVCSNCRL